MLLTIVSAPISSKPVSGSLPVCRPYVRNRAGHERVSTWILLSEVIVLRLALLVEPAAPDALGVTR
jgi:hypothetical protein